MHNQIKKSSSNDKAVHNDLSEICNMVLNMGTHSRKATSETLISVAQSSITLRDASMLRRCANQSEKPFPLPTIRQLGSAMSWDIWPSMQDRYVTILAIIFYTALIPYSVEILCKKFFGTIPRMEALEEFRLGFIQVILRTSEKNPATLSAEDMRCALASWLKKVASGNLDFSPREWNDGRLLSQAALTYGEFMLFDQ